MLSKLPVPYYLCIVSGPSQGLLSAPLLYSSLTCDAQPGVPRPRPAVQGGHAPRLLQAADPPPARPLPHAEEPGGGGGAVQGGRPALLRHHRGWGQVRLVCTRGVWATQQTLAISGVQSFLLQKFYFTKILLIYKQNIMVPQTHLTHFKKLSASLFRLILWRGFLMLI